MTYEELNMKYREGDYIRLSESHAVYDTSKESEKKLVNTIIDILVDAGFSAKYKGFSYIIDAVRIIYRKRYSHLLITKDIYVLLSKMYDVTVNIVEHNIRNAIQKAWTLNLNRSRKAEFFEKFNERPSNYEFLMMVSQLAIDKLSNPQVSLWDLDIE